MKISKIRDVKTPTRANPTDAGIDFFVPNDQETIGLKPGESAFIPSGIKVNCRRSAIINRPSTGELCGDAKQSIVNWRSTPGFAEASAVSISGSSRRSWDKNRPLEHNNSVRVTACEGVFQNSFAVKQTSAATVESVCLA